MAKKQQAIEVSMKVQLPPFPEFVDQRPMSNIAEIPGEYGKTPGRGRVLMPHAATENAVEAILDGGKSLGGALHSGIYTSRQEMRALARAAQRISNADRLAAREQFRDTKRQLQREAHVAAYLPKNGETGEQALRSYRRLKVEPHRATSEVLAGAYPFLAESGLGSEGVLIGQDAWSGAGFVYDPWVLYRLGVLTNPNVVLAGVVGRGKSTLAKSIATRSIAFGRQCYVPGDPKGEWSVVSRSVGGQVIALGDGTNARLNPLDEGPRPKFLTNLDGSEDSLSDESWSQLVRQRRRELLRSITESALGRSMAPVELTALFAALDDAVCDNSLPTLPQVVMTMFDPSSDVAGSSRAQLLNDGREVAHALSRLVGEISEDYSTGPPPCASTRIYRW